MEKQPAIKSYYFEKGYKDLKATIMESWELNKANAADHFNKAEFAEKFEMAFHWGAAISIYAFGTLWFLILSFFHVVILGAVFLVIYTSFSIVWGVDKIYRSINKIFGACPHERCHAKFDIPVYTCSSCNEKHTQLRPGEYGILKRTCTCGEKLPTSFFNGRSKLDAYCPKCENLLEGHTESRPIVLPFLGAPSVGKSTMLYSLMGEIHENIAKKRKWELEFPDKFNKDNYELKIDQLNRGEAVDKTRDGELNAVNLYVKPEKSERKRLLYFYDPAGELYTDMGAIAGGSDDERIAKQFFDYFDGVFLILDPFAIPMVHDEYADEIAKTDVRPSSHNPIDVLDRAIKSLEKHFGLKVDKKVKKPLAVVFTKVDAFDLEDKIGLTAAKRLKSADENIKTEDDAINKLCRDFLMNNDAGQVLQKIDFKFKKVRFFSVASLGEKSVRVSKPFEWIISNADKSLL